MERTVTTLTPVPPYDFRLTAAYATYFRGYYGAESFTKDVFRRLLDIRGCLCLVSVRSIGTVDSPRLELEFEGTDLDEMVVSEAGSQVAYVLGANQDLTRFYRMAYQDSTLTPLVRGLRGLHIPQTVSVYEALVLAIMGQQISANVARMLRTLLIQTYGLSLDVSGVTYHTFPDPPALVTAGVQGLRSAKLSTKKAEYIVGIARRVASGQLNLESLRTQSVEEVIRTLIGIRGVGLWTAQWILVRALNHTDGFPHGDLALRRTLGVLLKRDRALLPEEAVTYSRRWAPFRSYLTTYLLAAVRSGRFPELLQY